MPVKNSSRKRKIEPMLGTVTKKNADIGYGFIDVPKFGKIFFSQDTVFAGTSFKSLKLKDTVSVLPTLTERGYFAKSVTLEDKRITVLRPPEQTP